MIVNTRCSEAAPVKEALPGQRQALAAPFFNKRREAVAVFSIEPDSLSRRRYRLRRERGLFCGHRVPNGSRAFA
jgi:hypothetical protein